MRTTPTASEPVLHDPLTGGETRRESEERLITGLLMGRVEAYEAAATLVGPGDLSTNARRRLWSSIGQRHVAGQTIPPIDTLPALLERTHGGPDFSGKIGAYERAKRVRVHSIRTQIQIAADALARAPQNPALAAEVARLRADLDDLALFHDELVEHRRTAVAGAVAEARDSAQDLAEARNRYRGLTRAELLAALSVPVKAGA